MLHLPYFLWKLIWRFYYIFTPKVTYWLLELNNIYIFLPKNLDGDLSSPLSNVGHYFAHFVCRTILHIFFLCQTTLHIVAPFQSTTPRSPRTLLPCFALLCTNQRKKVSNSCEFFSFLTFMWLSENYNCPIHFVNHILYSILWQCQFHVDFELDLC